MKAQPEVIKIKIPGRVILFYSNSKVHDAPLSTVLICLYRTGAVSAGGTHKGNKN